MNLADAQKKAHQALHALNTKGIDPADGKQTARTASTFADLAADYMERHAKRHKKSWREDRRQLEATVLPRWKSRPVKSLQRKDVRDLIDPIVDRGAPVAANRVLALVSTVFMYGIDKDWLDANPAGRIKKQPEQSRVRVLTDIEAEVDDYLAGRASTVDAAGRRYVVRNGHLPPRAIQTPLGDVQVQQPRVRDRRPTDERETFRSAILPPYLRKTPSLEALYPWLYLKGISTGDFGEALQALLGPEARGLSATMITRLKAVWEQEYQDSSKRSLAHRSYAYVWADGVYFNVRLEDTDNKRQCILVLMGATRDGTKELIAITDGYRESEQSWRELLLDVRHRGLTIDPELAIGDGGLGFWGAVRKVFPQTREQRCWVHKTANVLNKLPTGVQPQAKAMLYDIWMAELRTAEQKQTTARRCEAA